MAFASDGLAPNSIVTSAGLELSWQRVSVGVVVDMAIMVKAEAFVGNGVRL